MKLWQLKPPSTVWSTISVGEKLFHSSSSDVSLSDRSALGWIVIWKILTRCLEFYYDLNNFCMWEIGCVKFHYKCLSASPKPLVTIGFYLPCITFLCRIALLKTRCVEPGSLIKLQKSIYNKTFSHRILFWLFIPVFYYYYYYYLVFLAPHVEYTLTSKLWEDVTHIKYVVLVCVVMDKQ